MWEQTNVEENNIDPDDGNSWVCNVCRLPIFSTHFTTIDHHHNLIVLHDQCANLPAKLEGHPLHPGADLILSVNNDNNRCSRCHSICGSRFYRCRDESLCGFQLDLACALTIRILHRSHQLKLTAMMGSSSSFICAACGTQHRPPHFIGLRDSTPWELSYVCSLCDFWIHPDCALLPNAIVIDKHHPHPLLLRYFVPSVRINVCAICDQLGEFDGMGAYTCFHCHYSVHLKCAVYSDPHSFKRGAQVPNLLRLPMANEHASVMSFKMKTFVTNVGDDHTTITSPDAHQSDGSKSLLFENDKVHEHPLIFHDHHQGGHQPVVDRVCDACVSPPDPFYSCSNNTNNGICTNFFLHACCAHLPEIVTEHPVHPYHPLSLLSKVNMIKIPFNIFRCSVCWRQCTGFAYACRKCDFHMDVCAFMPASITHDTHGKLHILRQRYVWGNRCNCCNETMSRSKIFYECNSCRNLNLHAKCTLFPDTVSHKFDRHPLKLITATRVDRQLEVAEDQEHMFCEICEKDIDESRWYYGCKECDQCFHIEKWSL